MTLFVIVSGTFEDRLKVVGLNYCNFVMYQNGKSVKLLIKIWKQSDISEALITTMAVLFRTLKSLLK
jgi:hypothetical protein